MVQLYDSTMISRLIQVMALLISVIPAAEALADTACAAQWNVLKVGMVPNNPLLIEAWISFYDVEPNGTAVLKDRNTLLRIARNSVGRVSIRIGSVHQGSPSPQNFAEPSHWMVTICDPQEKSTYWFSSNGDLEVIRSERGGIPGTLRFEGFSSPPSVARGGEQVALGQKPILEYSASGYKTWTPQNGKIESSLYLEQWFSESLDLELSHWDVKSGMRADVTRIDRREPSAELMTVPTGRKITQK